MYGLFMWNDKEKQAALVAWEAFLLEVLKAGERE